MYNCLFCFVVFQLPQAQKVKYFNQILVIPSSHQCFMFPWWCKCGTGGDQWNTSLSWGWELGPRKVPGFEPSSGTCWKQLSDTGAILTGQASSSLQLGNNREAFYQQSEITVGIKKNKQPALLLHVKHWICCRDCRTHGTAGTLSLLPTVSTNTPLNTFSSWLL